jgi:hypothetical protein
MELSRGDREPGHLLGKANPREFRTLDVHVPTPVLRKPDDLGVSLAEPVHALESSL